MGYRIRQSEEENQFCKNITLDVITQIVGRETIERVLVEHQAQEQRVRKLPAFVVVLLCIAMSLFSRMSIGFSLVQMVSGSRLLHDVDVSDLASKSGISRARYRLGAGVMQALFRDVCQPLATTETLGAFAWDLRVVAIDGTIEDVADTPANEAFFGRHHADRGDAAFPQVKVVYLCECGTHAIFDACFLPVHRSEHHGAKRVLRSVTSGMLVTIDRGLYSFDFVAGVRQREAHLLCRLSSTVKPEVIETLCDGSVLAYIYPSENKRRKQGERLLVRIITYVIDDAQRGDPQQVHRILTTLLDPDTYPATDLILCYHQRWEVEITIDEIDTHQRLVDRPLRSLKPAGVIQELYGVLLAHFVVRSIMHDAALEAQLPPTQLSFINSIRLICENLPYFQLVNPDDHPRLYQRLLRDIAHFRLPARDARINPRVVKRKMSKFKKKRPEHLRPPKLVPFSTIIRLRTA